jgi:Flp pilus assembly protein TadD
VETGRSLEERLLREPVPHDAQPGWRATYSLSAAILTSLFITYHLTAVFVHSAALYERGNRSKEASHLLEETSRAHWGAAAPLVDLAAIQIKSGHTKAATASYRQALEREPDSPLILNNLAYLLGTDPATRDEAIRLAESAHARAPGSASAADTLGWLLYLKGDLPRAEKLLAQAVAAEPRNPQMRYHLGKVFATQGRKAEARRELEETLRSGSLPEARDARAVLDSVK